MSTPQISNRPGPDCELTIRIKFSTIERFREDYHQQLHNGTFFLKTTRSKPLGTRVQLIFVIDPTSPEPTEIWSWGSIQKIITPQDAIQLQTSAGLEIKLMDMTANRCNQIERLFGVDEAVRAVLNAHSSSPEAKPQEDNVGYQVNRSERQQQIERVRDLLRLTGADHYVLLGIAKNASNDEVRAAFRRRSKEFHPDQYFRKIPEELQKELQKAFQNLTDAYRTLTDPKRRISYDISINNYTNPDAIRSVMPHVKRQQAFNSNYEKLIAPRNERVQQLLNAVDVDLQQGNPKGAQSKLTLAKALDPLNPIITRKMKEVKQLLPPSGG